MDGVHGRGGSEPLSGGPGSAGCSCMVAVSTGLVEARGLFSPLLEPSNLPACHCTAVTSQRGSAPHPPGWGWGARRPAAGSWVSPPIQAQRMEREGEHLKPPGKQFWGSPLRPG